MFWSFYFQDNNTQFPVWMELLVSNLIQLNRFSSIQSLHWAPAAVAAAAAAAAAAGTFWLRSGHLMLVCVVCHAPGRVRSSVPLTTRHPQSQNGTFIPGNLVRPLLLLLRRAAAAAAAHWSGAWCSRAASQMINETGCDQVGGDVVMCTTHQTEPLLMCRATCNFSSASVNLCLQQLFIVHESLHS